jgi:hypothetical protein
MKDGVKPVLVWVLIIAGVALGWWFYHSHETARKEAVQLKEKTDQLTKELMLGEFAKRHNAIVGWEATLPKRGEDLAGPFAIDFSRALIQSNAQPILFTASLSEVMDADGVATARFRASASHDELVLGLKCSPEQIAELAKAGVSRGVRFALIVKVERVSRPELRVSGPVDEPSSIDIETESSVILVKGTCVSLLRL